MIKSVDRVKRWSVLIPTAVLPAPLRAETRERLLRRIERTRARRARYFIIGHPKSGNTWVRLMISRMYQHRHGIPMEIVAKSDELNRLNPAIPRLLATNGCYSYERVVGEALSSEAPENELLSKKTILLLRHPCDVAVSWYLQFTKRQSAYKQELINHQLRHPIDRNTVELWDFVRNGEIGLPFLIDYMNTWERNVARLKESLVVRYEDLRQQPFEHMRRIADLLGDGFSDDEVRDAVDFGAFENMRKLETDARFRYGGLHKRTGKGDPEALKVRRGKVGGYRDYFTPEQVAELDALVVERLSPSLGYGPEGRVLPLGGV